jgi:phage terminase large subunit-like protein
MKKPSPDRYFSKDPIKRARQLGNLKQSSHTGRPKLKRRGQHDTNPFHPDYKNDICRYLQDHYILPETGKPVVLEPWQKAKVFIPLMEKEEHGIRLHTLGLIMTPKKNGKSTLASMLANYFLFHDEPNGEILIASNSREQSSFIILDKLKRSIQGNPHLAKHCKTYDAYITNTTTGTTARVVSPNWKTASGSNPSLVIFDELWAYSKENARTFYDELTQSPARKQPLTVIFSYAGYDRESLLYELYKAGKAGHDKHMFFFNTHKNYASWVTQEYLDSQRKRLRPNTYLRLHENRWVSSESTFISDEDYGKCVDNYAPNLKDKAWRIVVGVDVSTKKDSSAVVVVTKDGDKVRLICHKKWQPSPEKPIDLEEVEKYILQLAKDYTLVECLYDPYQFHRSATTLKKAGVPMKEFPATSASLTAMSQNVFNLFKEQNIRLYSDKAFKTHCTRAAAIETDKGWRIAKFAKREKIDLLIALALACHGAMEVPSTRIKGLRLPEDFFNEEEYSHYEDDTIWQSVNLYT